MGQHPTGFTICQFGYVVRWQTYPTIWYNNKNGETMSKNPVNKTIIKKTVAISQAIEGYAPANAKTIKKVQSLREKYGIKVSPSR